MKPKRTPRALTTAGLLAAPECDYMSSRQLEFFRHRLEEQRRALLERSCETRAHLQEMDISPDANDRASKEEEQALELRIRDGERKLMHQIDAALARIDSGQYGWCEDTGESIGIPRLLACPQTTLSVEAQARRESSGRSFRE